MTRMHFESLAANLKAVKPLTPEERLIWHECVNAVAKTCQNANMLFNKKRFVEAANS